LKAISSLKEMPERFKLYDDEKWHSQGLRCFSVDNYLVLYLTGKSDVTIVRIIYGDCDISKQLEKF
jgi:toxin ParE1/3/4